MKIIKKLDIFILKSYLLLFAGTFCICWFVLMMQSLWKYIDELVGKGLTVDILAKFFYYAGIALVPMALPLGVLLASLISFGNLGEKFELLAIKSSGISLFRTFRPLIIFNTLIACLSFYFQNYVGPKATEDLMTLRYSIMYSTPEVNIPEGAFYNGIPGLNMYVKHKAKNGILYDVIIYNMQDGANNARIILADSGKIESSWDKKEMILHLWSGEQFENLNSNSGLNTHNVPYRRETFVSKDFLLDFDTNLNMQGNEGISRMATTKSIARIMVSLDSMNAQYDSISVAFYNDMAVRTYYVQNSTRARTYPAGEGYINYAALLTPPEEANTDENAEKSDTTAKQAEDSTKVKKDSNTKVEKGPHLAKIPPLAPLQKGVEITHGQKVNIDTLYAHLNNAEKQNVIVGAMQKVNIASMDTDYKKTVMQDGDEQIRRHWIEIWTKVTMSLVCIIFFFIGAPLGAIIRKGGLGLSTVIAVAIFILFYMINTGGMRAGREGSIPVWFGMWLSTMVLTPIAIFLTVKANNDSILFNGDAWANFFRKLLGRRAKRHLASKEVIINDPDYHETLGLIEELITEARSYRHTTRRASLFGYIKYIYQHTVSRKKDEEAIHISGLLEHVVDILSNTKDQKILVYTNMLPVLETGSFRFYRRRRHDMKNIIDYGERLEERIKEIIYG